ncbi:trace amine-associated receptor 13c-like [Danio aesculapii]|uniref:trace amine-associated receptor 13c-like n=1 Tax=Danio aesculapii TaxID=1142201 RepID=UPI0024C0AABA|nr:trace amine-associated receptor 13c-like [Danio aesculapii]
MFGMSINEDNNEIQFCFPNNNLSCVKDSKPKVEYTILYIFVSLLSVFAVFLNLLVIISISHFRQLHTPTNMIVLSLAVADLIVGMIVIPLMGIRFIESCWYFGETFCSVFSFIAYTVVSVSLGNLVFVSVDRYIAVSDPLRYTVRVTTDRIVICIVINWLCCCVYSVIMLYNTMFYPETHDGCYGHCTIFFKFEHFVTDLIVTFVAPSCVILSIYVKIFCVAKHQAKFANSVTGVSKSQRKAGKTLGIVVMVYFMCWIPFYIVTLIEGNESTESMGYNITLWILYLNSCMNPLIYSLFYKWFRISAKHILTLRIFKPSSEYFNLFPEDK